MIIVEEGHAIPMVQVAVAARTGSSSDPRGQEGLMNLAALLARRGAAGRNRQQIDDAIDALGASLDVVVEPDSVRLVGQVLSRNLAPFLKILADIVLRADFNPDELPRTRRDILSAIDEMRGDDHALCARYFERRLFGAHPYGQPSEGTTKSLGRMRLADSARHFRTSFVGENLIFAAAGDVTAEAFTQQVSEAFAPLAQGSAPALPRPHRPAAASGWRVQVVDKPDRQQTQIMFGHVGPAATDPDALPLAVAMASFGGHGMKATLMDEARTKRGLAYGAYMDLVSRRHAGHFRGYTFTGADKTVTTLKLVLRLYKQLRRTPLANERVAFFKRFLVGSFASDMDSPQRRLGARLEAEIEGLPENFLDTYVERLQRVTPAQVTAAINRQITPENLVITFVATAPGVVKRLTDAKIDAGAIDVVDYESF